MTDVDGGKRERFARAVSAFTHAPFLSIPAFVLINNHYLGTPDFIVCSILCILFSAIIPVFITSCWTKRIESEEKDLPNKEDRIIPLTISFLSYILGAAVLLLVNAPTLSVALMFCYGTNTIIVSLISRFWKISIHAMGVMGPTVAMIFAFGPMGAVYGLILPIVMWSRYVLYKHTMGQLFAGAACGFILTFVQSYVIMDCSSLDVPPVSEMAWLTYAFVGPCAVLSAAGRLNHRGVKDGYTRKLFHFCGFGSIAAFVQFTSADLTAIFVISGILYVGISCVAGEGYLWYDGMRRRSDSPYERLYVIMPMVSTVLGLVLCSLLFDQSSVVAGMLCVAVGDAIAEPVGTLLGKHRYSVRAVVGKRTERSAEGSISIMLVCSVIMFVFTESLAASLLSGLILSSAEALSPRGTDNLTLFVIAGYIVSLM